MCTWSRSLTWVAVLVLLGGYSGATEGVTELSCLESELVLEPAANDAGIAASAHSSGVIDRSKAFFQTGASLQTGNLRTCETCHGSNQGWTTDPQVSTALFFGSDGLAPLFLPHDSGTRPDADISTFAARLLAWKDTMLNKGLTRFTRTINSTAEFQVLDIDDPYGFSTTTVVSNFRRPTPTTNSSKSSSITWTGTPTLEAISRGAANLHLQLSPPIPLNSPQVAEMASFQSGLVFAQMVDNDAGCLDADGAKGGPVHLKDQEFYIGINDIQGQDPMGHPFTPKVFDIFDAWSVYDCQGPSCPDDGSPGNQVSQARAAIWRGQELFNFYEFDIERVPGVNDLFGQTVVRGTCSTCHNASNVGGHSVFRTFDIGTANEENRSLDIPLLILQNKTTGDTRKVSDIGRGLNTGAWTDVGRFKTPQLRGLAARAPYFHDGQARSLKEVIKYYDERFNMGLTGDQKKDLEAFLRAL